MKITVEKVVRAGLEAVWDAWNSRHQVVEHRPGRLGSRETFGEFDENDRFGRLPHRASPTMTSQGPDLSFPDRGPMKADVKDKLLRPRNRARFFSIHDIQPTRFSGATPFLGCAGGGQPSRLGCLCLSQSRYRAKLYESCTTAITATGSSPSSMEVGS